jgi:GntR family transcriptional repressor for pyruvate dehydrogenase complex
MVENLFRLVEEDGPPLRRANDVTVSRQIMDRVRSALFDGRLRPGDYLGSEKEVAADFGVSRMAARDALRALSANGVVDIRVGAGGGIRVAAGDPEKFGDALSIQVALSGATNVEVLEAQLGIEERAAELAAVNRTLGDVTEMYRLIEAAEAAQGDALKFLRLGWDFHLAVAEASHNRVLIIQLKALRHVAWSTRGSAQVQGVSERVLTIHRDVAAAIEAGDAARARSIMRMHLDHMREGETLRDACC